jgi:hypothetical protein
MNSLFKFPRRVRIHGGECGAVARALHHEAQKVALTQNEQTLISDEKAFSRQADLGKSSRSTFIERKQMSTKTSIKRIALIAVSALGFGLLSVAPSQAAFGTSDYILLGEATIDNATTTLAGRVGQEVSITVTADIAALTTSTAQEPGLSIAAAITSQPASSAVYPTLTGSASYDLGGTSGYTTTTTGLTYDDADAGTVAQTGTASAVATLNYATAGSNLDIDAADNETVGVLTFTPTHAGTYSITVWNEKDRCNGSSNCATGSSSEAATAPTQASVSGSESYKVFTINVSSGVSSIVLTRQNASAVAGGFNGSLIKVSLKDAAGNAAILAPGETITLTPSGTGDVAAINGVAVTSTAGAAYNLASTDFNSSGIAWVNLTDANDGTTNLTAAINGGNTVSTSVTFVDTVTVSAAPAPVSTSTGWQAASSPDISVPIGASTISWAATASTGSTVGFTVTETVNSGAGAITGYSVALSYDGTAAGSTTLGYAAFSVTASGAATGLTLYEIATSANSGTAASATEAQADTLTNQAGALTRSPSLINAVVGSTNTITATLKDRFGRAYPYQTVTASVTGKNPTASALTAVTDADGKVTFSITDANSNTAVNDVVTITSGSSVSSTISYGTNTVGSVAMSHSGEDDVIAGTTKIGISTAATGATGTYETVTATITGSAGALLAGVPVTFSVAGLTGAEIHSTYVTVYTNASGEAATRVSSYAAGKATVTASAGGQSGTADVYFAQETASTARTISVAATGGVVTATVKDRYGNPVKGAVVDATRVGTGYFGSGASTAQGTTGANGTVEFVVMGDATVTVAFTTATYGQSADAAGKVGATAVTAAAAGTATTLQKGLGAALAPAGVNSASVAVSNNVNAAAEAASDAAAEAIDAANAATDAANLAAEAADAATVAAEEARDAADAATAAVEELATQVATLMAALKAQITTLANTVAKIAKKVKA